MVIYILVDIKPLERIQGFGVIQCVRERLRIKDGEKVGSADDAINVYYRDVAARTQIIRCYNPHPIVRVRPITKRGKPVNEGALVELLVNCE